MWLISSPFSQGDLFCIWVEPSGTWTSFPAGLEPENTCTWKYPFPNHEEKVDSKAHVQRSKTQSISNRLQPRYRDGKLNRPQGPGQQHKCGRLLGLIY